MKITKKRICYAYRGSGSVKAQWTRQQFKKHPETNLRRVQRALGTSLLLAPGGTKERKVELESLEICDLWHIGNDLGGYSGDAVIEVWHLAHDLKTALIEVWAMLDNTTTAALEMTTQRNLLLEACKALLPIANDPLGNPYGPTQPEIECARAAITRAS